jgi:hypothetical protein
MTKDKLTIEHTVIYRNGNSLDLDLMNDTLDNVKNYYNDDLTFTGGNTNLDIIEIQKEGKTIWVRDFDKWALKDGDVCKLRNGRTPTVSGREIIFMTDKTRLLLQYYSVDLIRLASTVLSESNEYDIMEVIRDGVVLFKREDSEPVQTDPKQAQDLPMYTTEELEIILKNIPPNNIISLNGEMLLNWFNDTLKVKHNDQAIKTELEDDEFCSRFNFSLSRAVLQSFPESVQLDILKAVSQKQKRKLIDL